MLDFVCFPCFEILFLARLICFMLWLFYDSMLYICHGIVGYTMYFDFKLFYLRTKLLKI